MSLNIPDTSLKVLAALRESGERDFSNRFGHKWRVANLPNARILAEKKLGFKLNEQQFTRHLQVLAKVGLFSKYDGANEFRWGDVRVMETD